MYTIIARLNWGDDDDDGDDDEILQTPTHNFFFNSFLRSAHIHTMAT